MKKFLLIICLALCLLTMSCSHKSTAEIVWCFGTGDGASTNDGYFMKDFTSSKMLFYDYKSKQTVPICSKPNCPHEKNSDCAAYISDEGLGSVSFIVYGNYIYYFTPKSFTTMSIIRANTDNSGQITIAEAEISSVSGIVAMNNKIYYSGLLHLYDEKGEEIIGSVTTINCLDLEKNTVTVIKNKSKDESTNVFFEGASKNYIFFLEIKSNRNNTSSACIKKISTDTLEETILKKADNVVMDYYNSTGAYFVLKKSTNEYDICRIDYETAQFDTLFSTDSEIIFVCADSENVMYSKFSKVEAYSTKSCYLYNLKSGNRKKVDFNNEGYQYFHLCAECEDFLIGDLIYENSQLRVQIKKDDFFSGKLKYNLIWNNQSTNYQSTK